MGMSCCPSWHVFPAMEEAREPDMITILIKSPLNIMVYVQDICSLLCHYFRSFSCQICPYSFACKYGYLTSEDTVLQVQKEGVAC